MSGAFAVQDGDAIEAEARAHLRDEARSVLTGLSDKDAADTALRSIATALPSQSADALLERVVDWHLASLRPHSDEAEGRRRPMTRSAAPGARPKSRARQAAARGSRRAQLVVSICTGSWRPAAGLPGRVRRDRRDGHSLGGALATLCVLDLRTNVPPLVNARLHRRKRRPTRNRRGAKRGGRDRHALLHVWKSEGRRSRLRPVLPSPRPPRLPGGHGRRHRGRMPPKKILPLQTIKVGRLLDRPNEVWRGRLVVDLNIVESTFSCTSPRPSRRTAPRATSPPLCPARRRAKRPTGGGRPSKTPGKASPSA